MIKKWANEGKALFITCIASEVTACHVTFMVDKYSKSTLSTSINTSPDKSDVTTVVIEY